MHSRILLFFLVAATCTGLPAQVLEQDSLALVALYNATNGDSWSNNTDWLDGPVNSWYGIQLTGDRVSRINLWSNNLTGFLPDEIGDLTALERLDIDDNAITGSLPASLGNCTALEELDISVNGFTGTFPEEMKSCTTLYQIIAYRNELSGPFPEVLLRLPAVTRIEINSNAFSGPLPVAIDTLSQINTFAVSRNNFSGPMPSIRNMTSVSALHLHENDLEGQLDTIFGYHPNLYYCTINDNNFSGCVSETHFNPDKIQYLHVQVNRFDCLGDFSTFIEDGALERLYASNNRFDFDDLEKNRGASTFSYSPQDSTLSNDVHVLQEGDSITIHIGAGGTFPTTYTWFKDNLLIPGENGPTLHIDNFSEEDIGSYFGKALNDSLPNLVLSRHQVRLVDMLPSAAQDVHFEPLSLYPNPAIDVFTLSEMDGHGSVEIISTSGRRSLQVTEDLSQPLSLVGVTAGCHIVRVTRGADIYLGKLIKM